MSIIAEKKSARMALDGFLEWNLLRIRAKSNRDVPAYTTFLTFMRMSIQNTEQGNHI